MKQKILGITALFCAMFFVACSNIIEALKPEEKFEAQSTNFSLPEGSTLTKVTSSTSANEEIVTAILNEDGTVTFTSVAEGKTTVAIKGTNAEGKTVTLTYEVSVDKKGGVEIGDTPAIFTNETEKVTPGTESVTVKSTEDATANPADVVTVIVNDDGTVTITAEKAGTTTVTVKGKNENGETVTLTYTVTVAADGTFSMGEPAAFTNDTENVTPKTDTVTVKTITSASSKDESVVTVIINDDGTTTLTAQSSGTTTLTVKGKDENGEDVTLTYTVTVAEDGTISRSEATVFKNETEKVTPKSGSTELKTTESVESADDSIVTVSKNDDGTISFTGESVGTTTVIITGTNENGEPVTLTYTVTVENDGTITVKESKVINPLENTPVKTVTSAVSGDESVITVIKNEDGTTTLTAQAAGTTTLTIKGKNENGETVTLTYNVTVAEDGSITMSEPAIFTNDTEKVTPKTESETIKTVTSAVSGDESVITVIKNEDGTTTLTAQSSGTTTFTVKGTNENDEIVTLTYTVTVAEDGTITVGEPTESVNGNATVTVEIAPESAISITSAQDGSTITLTASEGFTDYKWHIDGVSAESVTGAAVSGDGRTLTLTKANFTGTGVYQIYIIATKDSIPYDAQISVTNSTSN